MQGAAPRKGFLGSRSPSLFNHERMTSIVGDQVPNQSALVTRLMEEQEAVALDDAERDACYDVLVSRGTNHAATRCTHTFGLL